MAVTCANTLYAVPGATVTTVTEPTLLIDALGARWRLVLDGVPDATRAHLARIWDRARAADDGAKEIIDFTIGPSVDPSPTRPGVRASPSSPGFDYAVSRALTLASITRRAGDALMFHAAGLAAPSGATAVLVAGSGTGKSTASRVLGRHFGYVSDENITVEADGSISPYPKPLSIIGDPDAPYDKDEFAPDELGLRPAPADPYVAAVVELQRDPAHQDPTLVDLPLIDALIGLIPQTSSVMLLARPLQRLTEVVTRTHGPWALRYAEIEQCVPIITRLLDGDIEVPGAVQWRAVPPGPHLPEPGADQHLAIDPAIVVPYDDLEPDERVQHTAYTDAVATPDGVLILVRGDVLHFEGLGALVWEECAVPRTVDELVAAATAQLGEHPQARRLVQDTVRAMRRGGVLALV